MNYFIYNDVMERRPEKFNYFSPFTSKENTPVYCQKRKKIIFKIFFVRFTTIAYITAYSTLKLFLVLNHSSSQVNFLFLQTDGVAL